MRPSPSGFIFVAAAFATLFLGAAYAQIDYRVNQGNELGGGRALDNNPMVGTGGLNPSASPFDFGLRSNAIVSGNVSGLAGFRGYSPVPQSNQFRAGLPTAGLSSFEARSTSVQDVQQNRFLVPTFYFGRQETIADLGYLRSGLNVPGSSMLASPYTSPFRAGQPLGWRFAEGVSDSAPTSPDQRAARAPGIRQQQIGTTSWRDPLASANLPFADAAQSSIFGIPSPTSSTAPPAGRAGWAWRTDRESPSSWEDFFEAQREAYAGEQRTPDKPSEDATFTSRPSRGTTSMSPGDAPRERGGSGGGAADSRATAREGLRDQVFDRAEIRPGYGRTDSAVGSREPQAGADSRGDSYNAMLQAVAAAQRLGVRNLAFELTPAKPPVGGGVGAAQVDQPAAPTAIERADAKELRRRADAGVADLAAAARWAADRLEHPLTTFVGTQQTRFNDVMAAAESFLRTGAYYRAADQYSLAHTLNPDDPLPLLGRGHALAAAGDLRTAAAMLERGIAKFPQIAAFRLDLIALVGNRDVFDRRRAELEQRLTEADSYDLRFLLGYLELYSGLDEEGISNLERAAKLAPPGSAVAAFPEFLLGRRALPVIDDQPAAPPDPASAP